MQKKESLIHLRRELAAWNRILELGSEKLEEESLTRLLRYRDRAQQAQSALCGAMELTLVAKGGLARKIYLLAMVLWVRPLVKKTRFTLKALNEKIRVRFGDIVEYGEIMGSPYIIATR